MTLGLEAIKQRRAAITPPPWALVPEERWQRVRDYATRHLKGKVEA